MNLEDLSFIDGQTVDVYLYNPSNIKEVIGVVQYAISYKLKKDWNYYGIFINGKYSGMDFNICVKRVGNVKCINDRRRIGLAISNYNKNINYDYIQFETHEPPLESKRNKIIAYFKYHVLPIKQYKNRDELTSLGFSLK